MTVPPYAADSRLPNDGIPFALRYFDCVLVLAFLPFGLLAGLPTAGVVGGVAIWFGQRLIGVLIERYAVRQDNVRTMTGLTFASGMLRPLLIGLTILALGQLGEREDGLTAALIALVAFTVYMILSVIFRPQRKPRP